MFQYLAIACLLGLTGAVPAGFDKYPQDLVVVSGTSVTYQCKLTKANDFVPRIYVKFTNGTDMILNSRVNGKGYYEVSRANKVVTVKILSVTQETEGSYKCIGLALVNDADLDGPYVELRVTVHVGFIEAPKGTVYYPPPGLPGKIVQCKTNVTADIHWVSARYGALKAEDYNLTQVSGTTSFMYLTSEFVKSNVVHGGVLTLYTYPLHCEAGGVDSSSFMLQEGELPRVTVNPKNVAVDERQSTRFSCSYADTTPSLTGYTWRFTDKNGTITFLKRTDIPGDGQSGLSIPSAVRSDAGRYACVVENEFGRDVSLPGTLTVNYFGDVILTVKPSTVVKEGSHVILECVVDAVPPATEIRLSRNNGPFYSLSNSRMNLVSAQYHVASNNITVTFTASGEWTGQLTCFGFNGLGNDSHTVSFDKLNYGLSTTNIVIIVIFGGGSGVSGIVIAIYIVKKKKRESLSVSLPVCKDHVDHHLRDDMPPAPSYMTTTQQETGVDKTKHTGATECVASESQESNTGLGPTYIQGELSREEDHPQRRGDPQDGRETGAETTISDYAPMLYESSAYGKVLPGVRDLDSDIRMQESSAYGVDMKTQPTCSIPM